MGSPDRKGAPAASGDTSAAKTIRVGVRTKHSTQHGDHAFPYMCAGHRFHQKETMVDVSEGQFAEIRSKSHALTVRVLDGSIDLPTAEEIVSREKVIDTLRSDVDRVTRENTDLRAKLAAFADPEDESEIAPMVPPPPRPAPPAGVPKMG